MHALDEDEEMKRECEEMVQGMYIYNQAGKRNKIPRNETAKNEREREESTSEQQSGEVGGNILDF